MTRFSPRPRPTAPLAAAAMLSVALAFLLAASVLASSAQAAKQPIDFFGGNGDLGGQFSTAAAVVVNETGAGPANTGDIYVIDNGNSRIQRFGHDENGTPGNSPTATADDTYFFISAWGADVDATPSGGAAYEICTVANDCQQAVASGGDGTTAGNGSLSSSSGIALDQDTGEVYVADADNNRVSVYAGDGDFLRSFGYDVIASGPGDAGTGYEVCAAADGDVCKTGLRGAAAGQIGTEPMTNPAGVKSGAQGIAVSAPDGNPATGTVFLADAGNRRVNTYELDGASPSSFGSVAEFSVDPLIFNTRVQPSEIAVDSRGIVYIGAGGSGGLGSGDYRIERYDSANANGGGIGFLAPIRSPQNEEQRLLEQASAGQFRLTFGGDTTADLPFNASAAQAQTALEALPSIGAGNIAAAEAFLPDKLITINFVGALANTDVQELVLTNGTTPLTGSIPVSTVFDGHGGLAPRNPVLALAVDPDTDGGGPDTDVLYAERGKRIEQFGPANPAGLTAPPSAVDDVHGTSNASGSAQGLAAEASTGRLYAATGGTAGSGVYVLDEAGPPPTATMDSVDGITTNSADLHATIDPNGPPATRYHFEYSTNGSDWISLPEVFLGAQEDPQAVSGHLEPPLLGLDPNTLYHVRLVAGRRFADPLVTNTLTFTTAAVPPLVETAGAPVRTTTTAQLNGRVTPLGSAATYHFEYGSAGPCDANPCDSTPSVAAGSGQLMRLVAAKLTGLDPDTTYHYRLVADNGVGAPVAGDGMTVTTRASDELPGQSNQFPGPPGSDRAWEQVSLPDPSGNPVSVLLFSNSFSDAGDRAVYGIAGGTSISATGSADNLHYAERTPDGWQSRRITPARDELVGSRWLGVHASADLSTVVTSNIGVDSGTTQLQIWRLHPDSSPELVSAAKPLNFFSSSGEWGASFDGSRVLGFLGLTIFDPTYPTALGNIYDLGSANPELVSLLPGNLVSPCGATPSIGIGYPSTHWLSDDGSLAFFESRPSPPCNDPGATPKQLYLRDLVADQTKLVSGPPLSGPDCGGTFIKANAATAFFTTSSRLDPSDADPAGCTSSNDIYRYDLGDESLECVTCLFSGFSVNIIGSDHNDIAVPDNGSRVYFRTSKRLLRGAPDGGPGIYRIDLATSSLAFVAPSVEARGTNSPDALLTPDGSTFAFASDLASANPLGGVADNAGTRQFYRYDDADRSLVCVTCPQDGSPALGEPTTSLNVSPVPSRGLNNHGVMSADGQVIAFATPTRLVGVDQNTPGAGNDPAAGIDVYEWRDGRPILVTDGVISRDTGPGVLGVTPSGNDIFIVAAAAYTPDAPDALPRLYDARIGGGFNFPPPGLPPCDLNSGACEGPGTSAPDLPGAGSAAFEGQGDPRDPFPRDCSAASQRAAKLSRLARALRNRARRAANPRRAKALRRKVAKLSRKAKKGRGDARTCRRANRGASR